MHMKPLASSRSCLDGLQVQNLPDPLCTSPSAVADKVHAFYSASWLQVQSTMKSMHFTCYSTK